MNGIELYIKSIIDDYLSTGVVSVIISTKQRHRGTISDEVIDYVRKLESGSDDDILSSYNVLLDVLNVSHIADMQKTAEEQKQMYL